MKARRALAAAAVMVCLGAASAGAQSAGELRIDWVDAREFPTISVIVTPPPELLGIEPAAITLTENGVELPATVTLLTDQPLEVLLAIDTSGSMRDTPLESAKAAAASFVEAMPPTTRVAVMGFATEPSLVSDFSADPETALTAISTLEASGETALYDAVSAAIDTFPSGGEPRRFIVLLSDGGDTVSSTPLDDAVEALEASGLSLYAVELQSEETDPEPLIALTGTGSGRVVAAEDSSALAEVYGQIASELVNQLAVTYVTQDGGDVRLTITITDPQGTATGSGPARLPIPAPPATTAPTTTAAPVSTTVPGPATDREIEVTAAQPAIGSGPGPFGSGWAFHVGIVGLSLAALIVFGMALVPADDHTSQLRRVRERFEATGGLLTRLTSGVQSRIDRALARPGRGARLTAALDAAGIRLSAGEFAIVALALALVGTAVGLALLGFVGAVIGGTLTFMVPLLVLAHRREQRRSGFGDQMEAVLQLLSGSLRAGYGLLQAISTVAAEAPSPSSDEFSRIMVETRVGRDLGESMRALADRMGNEDFLWVTQAIEIQRTVGGDLSEILDTVATTIRERNQIRRQVKALSAEGRISSYVLIALPFVVSTFLVLVAPEFLTPLIDTLAGRIALGGAIVLLLIGIVWIRRLVKIVF